MVSVVSVVSAVRRSRRSRRWGDPRRAERRPRPIAALPASGSGKDHSESGSIATCPLYPSNPAPRSCAMPCSGSTSRSPGPRDLARDPEAAVLAASRSCPTTVAKSSAAFDSAGSSSRPSSTPARRGRHARARRRVPPRGRSSQSHTGFLPAIVIIAREHAARPLLPRRARRQHRADRRADQRHRVHRRDGVVQRRRIQHAPAADQPRLPRRASVTSNTRSGSSEAANRARMSTSTVCTNPGSRSPDHPPRTSTAGHT